MQTSKKGVHIVRLFYFFKIDISPLNKIFFSEKQLLSHLYIAFQIFLSIMYAIKINWYTIYQIIILEY